MSYEEQIMSKDKYPSIFSPQMEAIMFIILQIFFATRAVLKIGEYLTIRQVAQFNNHEHALDMRWYIANESLRWL